jgi:hypothetical protein
MTEKQAQSLLFNRCYAILIPPPCKPVAEVQHFPIPFIFYSFKNVIKVLKLSAILFLAQ